MITDTLNIDWVQSWSSALGLSEGYGALLIILATIVFLPVVISVTLFMVNTILHRHTWRYRSVISGRQGSRLPKNYQPYPAPPGLH